MSHDLIAELNGYRDELRGYEREKRTDRVKAVETEIDRVSKQVRVEAEKLIARAENHEEAGQDVLAAQCRVEARRLFRESNVGEPETAVDSTPTKAAVPSKATKKSEA